MHKLLFLTVLRAAKILATAAYLAADVGVAAAAPNGDWSFDEHPHPTYDEMTKQEQVFYDSILDLDNMERWCEKKIAADYKIYIDRYPDYLKSGDEKGRLKQWKRHLAYSTERYVNFCLFRISGRTIIRLTFSVETGSDFYFCGHYSRPPFSANERRLVEAIDEAVEFAKAGSLYGVENLMLTNDVKRIFELNADIEYYFRKLTKPYLGMTEELRDTAHLDHLFDAERKAFLDRAVAQENFQAVLETSPPCKPRKSDAGEYL